MIEELLNKIDVLHDENTILRADLHNEYMSRKRAEFVAPNVYLREPYERTDTRTELDLERTARKNAERILTDTLATLNELRIDYDSVEKDRKFWRDLVNKEEVRKEKYYQRICAMRVGLESMIKVLWGQSPALAEIKRILDADTVKADE